MHEMPKSRFPEGSLLAAMSGDLAPVDIRRAARRLRAEGAPAVAINDDTASLALGLASTEISRSLAVLDVLPPLFWLEAQQEDQSGIQEIGGWIVETKQGRLAARGFRIALGAEAAPEPLGTATITFGERALEEGQDIRYLRGLITAISLPGLMAQMGESSPVVLMPADACEQDKSLLRGFRLSVAVSADSVPS
jgi:hypothetical protein